MNILLIHPFANESNTNYPPMGLLSIASYLQVNTEHNIKLFDLRAKKTPIEEKLPDIKSFKPDVVGVSGLPIEWSGTRKVLDTLHSALDSNVVFVAGGPHATVFKRMVLEKTPVKYIVRNEGEVTFLELLSALETGKDPQNIPGLFIKGTNGEVIETAVREFIDSLDTLPFPAYDLLNLNDYFENPHIHGNLYKHNRVLPIFTSRGCPFHCHYCCHMMGFKYRARSPESVLKEIDWLVNTYGVQELQIEDDTFNLDIKRAKKIMRDIISRNYNLAFTFPSGIRAELVDEELMDLFRLAGVYRIHYGLETITPRIQKLINKQYDIRKINNTIELTSSAGIGSHGFFMMGFPTETEREIRQTIDYAANSKLTTASFSILKIFPGTPFGDKYFEEEPSFEDDFTFSYDAISFNHSAVADAKLKKLNQWAYLKFYLRPRRIWQIFLTSPNKRNLFFKSLVTVLSLIFRGKAKY